MKQIYLKFSMLLLCMVVGMSAFADTWTRCTSVSDLTSGGTFIIGYEATANSGKITPMKNTGGTATTSAAGYMASENEYLVDMSKVTATADYEFTIVASTVVEGAICIKAGDNYIGNTNTKNNLKLFTEESATTAFGVTVGTNDVFTLKIAANASYHTLQYNSGSPRFAVYGGTQKDLVIYKKDASSSETATLTSIAVSGTPTKTTYTEGDSFDPAGLVVTGTYSDNSTKVITTGIKWTVTPSPLTSGTTSVSVVATTNGISSPSYTVEGLTVSAAAPVVTTFSSLEELVAADLTSGTTVTVSFENVPIKSIFTTSQGYRNGIYFDIQKGGKDIEIYFKNVPDSWVEGGKVSGTMTCPWKLYSGTWELAPETGWAWTNLTYTAPADVVTLTSIAVSGTPTKKEYVEGDKFETAGLVVTGTYSDNSTKEITTDAKWTVTPSTLTAGTTSVKVVAKVGQITSAEYTVSGLTVKADAQNVTFDLTKDQTTTATTEKLEWVNTAVTMTAAKGSSSTNTNNFYPGKGSTSTRFYTNSILSLTPASGIKISSIVVTTTTDGYASSLAESTWTNATTKINGTIVTITPTDGTIAVSAVLGGTVGATSVKVYYEGEAKASVSKIELSGSYQTEFTKGDAFSSTGMVVTATYTDGTTKDVTSKVTVSGYNASETGIQTITVSYTEEGKTVETTYEVKVTAPLSKAEEGYEVADLAAKYSEDEVVSSYQGTSFEMTFAKPESSSTPTKYYAKGDAVRAYVGNTISITGAENIKNVLVNYVSGYVDDGAKTEIDGKKATITFSKTCRFTSIVVVYANPTLAIGSTGYATYYNSKVAYIMPEGCTGSIFTVANGLKATYNAGDAVPANEALVISGTPGDKELVLTTTNKSNSAGSNDLKGTDEEQELEEYGGFYYYALSVDKEGNNVGFYWMNSTGAAFKNGAHKAYLMAAGSPANAKNFIFGETTAIKTIATATDAKIYDLTGREVKSPKAGIYVVNGVKKYIK